MAELSDKWTAGATYEDFMGRWSRLLAPRFVSWLSVRPTANWLDVGLWNGRPCRRDLCRGRTRFGSRLRPV